MPERYLTSTIEPQAEISASARLEKKPNPRDLFRNLPVAQNTNLDILSPLIESAAAEQLITKVENRYLDIINLRKGLGFYERPLIDFNMAIAILDDKLFEAVKEETKQEGRVLKTARHEVGHEASAGLLGFEVMDVTVVPGAGYLGLTRTAGGSNLSPADFLIRRAAISLSGGIAAEMMKDPVVGTGSDRAHAEALATIAVAYGYYPSEAIFLTHAQNLAHATLRSFGESNIEKRAQLLLYRRTITSSLI